MCTCIYIYIYAVNLKHLFCDDFIYIRVFKLFFVSEILCVGFVQNNRWYWRNICCCRNTMSWLIIKYTFIISYLFYCAPYTCKMCSARYLQYKQIKKSYDVVDKCQSQLSWKSLCLIKHIWWWRIGKWRYRIIHSSSQHYVEVVVQIHTPAAFPPGAEIAYVTG